MKLIKQAAAVLLCLSVSALCATGLNALLGKNFSSMIINSYAFMAIDGKSGVKKATSNQQKEQDKVKVSEVNIDNLKSLDEEKAPDSSLAVGSVSEKSYGTEAATVSGEGVHITNKTGTAINIKGELSSGTTLRFSKSDEPEILIVHTHTTENYMGGARDYYTEQDLVRSTNENKGVMAVGDALKSQLESEGFSVVHDKSLHDYPSYSGSYSRSAKTVKADLEKYPSVKLVIDLHRDSITYENGEKVRTVSREGDKDAAQIMLVMGSNTGDVTNFPEWEQNLRLALLFQKQFEADYSCLSRPLLLKSAVYNENLTVGSVLIEVGTDANTLSEAVYSGFLAGKSIGKVLKTLK